MIRPFYQLPMNSDRQTLSPNKKNPQNSNSTWESTVSRAKIVFPRKNNNVLYLSRDFSLSPRMNKAYRASTGVIYFILLKDRSLSLPHGCSIGSLLLSRISLLCFSIFFFSFILAESNQDKETTRPIHDGGWPQTCGEWNRRGGHIQQ